jgi:pimeloyl-ACP methyl ester carboxylesterase/peroxiredoxin
MVLILSRGAYCPKDRREHEGLLQLHREMEVGYCRLVTISTDNITDTNEFRTGVGAHWPFLSDPRRIIQKELDIAEYIDPQHNPMIPHTIVLEPGLVIYKLYIGHWFFDRPTVEDLRQDLRTVIRKCRPDWDITAPEMKAAWQQGRKELFYPYGKNYAQTISEQEQRNGYRLQTGTSGRSFRRTNANILMNRPTSLAMPGGLVWMWAAFVLMSGNAAEKIVQKELDKAEIGRVTSYRTKQIDGVSIFYREAGPKDRPTLLLLHGLPSSSRMFEALFSRLSDRYHLIAPDYPGFGHSDWPDPKKFAYMFDHIAEIMNHFTEALGLSRYTLYMQDYGVPVGFRMVLAHPERVEALIVQDGVAHNEGLGANWKTRREFWKDRAANEAALRTNLLSLQTTKTRHVGDDPNVALYDPDLWTDEYAFLNAPGQAEIQSDLFYDYRTNVDAYPKWQAWMQKTQPKLLVIWGRHDLSFDPGEPERYRKDVPNAEVHVLDAGHFALDTKADEIATLVRAFMK